jgi:DNA-binding MarR family transcriptional regulator
VTSISSSNSPDTRAVTDDLIAIFGHVLKHSSTPIVEFAERYDLSFTQLKVMFALAQSAEPSPIGRIARRTGASLPAAGRAIDGLVRHGLADRSEAPDDRRVKLVQSTALGDDAMRELLEARAAILEQFLNDLTGDELSAIAEAIVPLRGLVETHGCELEDE